MSKSLNWGAGESPGEADEQPLPPTPNVCVGCGLYILRRERLRKHESKTYCIECYQEKALSDASRVEG